MFKTLAKPVRSNDKAEVIHSPVDPLWVKEWSELYWADDVNVEIEKARLWCLDQTDLKKLPTGRGLRAFLGNWIRRSNCRLRPKARLAYQQEEERPEHDLGKVRSALAEMKAKLGV